MEILNFILPFILVTFGNSLNQDNGPVRRMPCASVYCSEDFFHETIQLPEELDCRNNRIENYDTENITSFIQVEIGCNLTACNQFNFKTECLKFTEGFSTLSYQFGSNLSLNCSCLRMEMNVEERREDKNNSNVLRQRKKRSVCGIDDDEIQDITGRALSSYSRKCQEEIRSRQRELNRRRGGGAGCLKEHTMILMADLTEKPVQLLEVGDLVMDHNLLPVRVGGVLKKFLLQDSFHGFDNQTFFFTDTHQIVGRTGASQMQIYAKDLEKTIKENPLLAYLEVQQLPETSEILHFDSGSLTVDPETVTEFTDPKKYSKSTLVYIILVDSEIGTYIANEFVCRHEIPPMEYWPNTMSLLFSLVSETGIKWIEDVPYTLETVRKIEMIADQAFLRLEEFLQAEENGVATNSVVNGLILSDRVITEIFSNPTFSAFAVGVYGSLGPLLAKHLDGIEGTKLKEPTVDQVKVYEQLKVHFAQALSDAFASLI